MKNKFIVSEIFNSIDGEGIRTGYIVTFIRLYGCNLRCKYCDSMYAVNDKEELKKCKLLSVEELIKEVEKNSITKKITLTGGEPLLNKELSKKLIKQLTKKGYEINIETNGSIDISDFVKIKKTIITMDWKSIYSGEKNKMLKNNLKKLRKQDVLKFVVAGSKDLDQMYNIIKENKLKCNIFVSPVFGEILPLNIVNYLLYHKINNVRLQLQLHKFIWEPSKRGV